MSSNPQLQHTTELIRKHGLDAAAMIHRGGRAVFMEYLNLVAANLSDEPEIGSLAVQVSASCLYQASLTLDLRMLRRRCSRLGLPGLDPPPPGWCPCGEETRLVCKGCISGRRPAFYCGTECQLKDWPNHKQQCKLKVAKIQDAERAAAVYEIMLQSCLVLPRALVGRTDLAFRAATATMDACGWYVMPEGHAVFVVSNNQMRLFFESEAKATRGLCVFSKEKATCLTLEWSRRIAMSRGIKIIKDWDEDATG